MLNFYIFLGILLIILTLFAIICVNAEKDNKGDYVPIFVLAIATIGTFIGTLVNM